MRKSESIEVEFGNGIFARENESFHGQ